MNRRLLRATLPPLVLSLAFAVPLLSPEPAAAKKPRSTSLWTRAYGPKQLDPACFINHTLGERNWAKRPIDLTPPCWKGKIERRLLEPAKMKERGLYGIVYSINGKKTPKTPYIFIRYLGKIGSEDVIWIEENRGREEQLSIISRFMQLNPTTIKAVNHVAYGDRCNGGIEKAAIDKNGVLTYTQRLTPMDLLTLADKNVRQLRSNTDLAGDAKSCFATGDFENGKLVKVQLQKDAVSLWRSLFSESPTYQSCFNKHMEETLKQGSGTLDNQQLYDFASSFYGKCLKSAH